jgi:hypothetical protein
MATLILDYRDDYSHFDTQLTRQIAENHAQVVLEIRAANQPKFIWPILLLS